MSLALWRLITKMIPAVKEHRVWGINMYVNITIVQGRVEPARNSASCTRIEGRRPCPIGIKKSFAEEVVFELSFGGKIEF